MTKKRKDLDEIVLNITITLKKIDAQIKKLETTAKSTIKINTPDMAFEAALDSTLYTLKWVSAHLHENLRIK